MPCVTHHDACECRMEVVRELAGVLFEYVAECVFCEDGKLCQVWNYPRYRAPDGSCARCYDGRLALAAAWGCGWA